MRTPTPVRLSFSALTTISALALALSALGCPGPVDPPLPVCGNMMVETGEQCDDGNTTNGDGCSATCLDETPGGICGDGTVDAGEDCDDGNTMDGDGCSALCLNETTCGDGIIQLGEQCEPPNTATCDSMCQIVMAPPFMCPASSGTLNCGDTVMGDTNTGMNAGVEHCGAGATDWTGNELAYEFVGAANELIGVNLTGLAGDMDIFISESPTCNTTACVGAGGVSTSMTDETATAMVTAGTTYWIVIDGWMGANSAFSLNLQCASMSVCGNGTVDLGEDCDDGNVIDGDGCSSTCASEAFCVGDAVVGPADLLTMNPTTLAPFTPAADAGALTCTDAVGCGGGPETVIEVNMPMGTTDLSVDFNHTGGDQLYGVYGNAGGMCAELDCYDPFGITKNGNHVFPGVSDGLADTTVWLIVEACMPVSTNVTVTAQ